nr:hypothetical protein [Maioricimonas rarisocia]
MVRAVQIGPADRVGVLVRPVEVTVGDVQSDSPRTAQAAGDQVDATGAVEVDAADPVGAEIAEVNVSVDRIDREADRLTQAGIQQRLDVGAVEVRFLDSRIELRDPVQLVVGGVVGEMPCCHVGDDGGPVLSVLVGAEDVVVGGVEDEPGLCLGREAKYENGRQQKSHAGLLVDRCTSGRSVGVVRSSRAGVVISGLTASAQASTRSTRTSAANARRYV